MCKNNGTGFLANVIRVFSAFVVGLFLSGLAQARTITITVKDAADDQVTITDFRWLIEENNTSLADPDNFHGHRTGVNPADPSVDDPFTPDENLSMGIHRSHAPVLAKGCVGVDAQAGENDTHSPAAGTCGTAQITLPDDVFHNGRLYISVLPYNGGGNAGEGYALGGVEIPAGNTDIEVTAIVNKLPLKTAQVAVYVFEDIAILNNAPDQGERGLENFSIIVEDAGGKYGHAGAQQMADVFGNPLGTTYDANGDVAVLGTGVLRTDADGMLRIKNLAPGKYGIKVVPPHGDGVEWQQTTTIEGSTVIDAWVRSGEPDFFVEFGPPQPYHAFFGFTRRTELEESLDDLGIPYTGGNAHITGTIHAMHTPRPPDIEFNHGPRWDVYNGASNCWYGLNDLNASGGGKMILAKPCGPESSIDIPGLKDGAYQLVVWDRFMDAVIGFYPLTVMNGECVEGVLGSCDLGKVGVFAWFARIDNHIYYDTDSDGMKDDGEPGIPELAVNLRFRDGTIYKSFPTDLDGFVPFDQFFPFFHFLVAEVDFGRFKATGLTVHVDEGGPLGVADDGVTPQANCVTPTDTGIDPDCKYPELMNPQIQADGKSYYTETGPVLTTAFQSFLGTINVFEWGKQNYENGESGGLSGMVFYAITRAEDEPKNAAAEPWEPGIPRVQINLYAKGECDYDLEPNCDIRADVNGVAGLQEADVDNYPLGFSLGLEPGAEDTDVNGNGMFDAGEDTDAEPFGWQLAVVGPEDTDHNGNGLFDTGDAMTVTWTDAWDDSMPTGCPASAGNETNGTQAPFMVHGTVAAQDCADGMRTYNQARPGIFDGGWAIETYDPDGDGTAFLDPVDLVDGFYVVEMVAPRGYEHLKVQDRNVDFGEEYAPDATVQQLPLDCFGPLYDVPTHLTLFPGVEIAPTLANTQQHLCNMKVLEVRTGYRGGGYNAATDFFLFTEVPKAARGAGMLLDDLSNQFDPTAPNFGEKYSPPYIPVSLRDTNYNEIARVYSDEFGSYNYLVPSTFTTNLPAQSGMSPNMITACLNDPGPIDDGNGNLIIDPLFKRGYGQMCWTYQFMPGNTTYLDTPIVPISAFASNYEFPLDCECEDGTPVIYSVDTEQGSGPYVSDTAEFLYIYSMGTAVQVPDPEFDNSGGTTNTTTRDFGFGASGVVRIGGQLVPVQSWDEDLIVIKMTPSSTEPRLVLSGDLEITRTDNGLSTSKTGLRITNADDLDVGADVYFVTNGSSIQTAIDNAADGDMIIVKPGNYNENLILDRNVRIQGSGARSTFITAKVSPKEAVLDWQRDLFARWQNGDFDLLPGQNAGSARELLTTELAAGISVFGDTNDMDFSQSGIDGFTIHGANNGGGILVNGYVHGLEISNNVISGNQGQFGGGIRVGSPDEVDADNDNLNIHHNRIVQNGGGWDMGPDAGGGISIFGGANQYQVRSNDICGNFTLSHGAGLAHIGWSDDAEITDNIIRFNEGFSQAMTTNGGGIYLAGQTAIEDEPDGAGDVKILRNVIQGNNSGSGDGGAIATQNFVGALETGTDGSTLTIENNMIVNNVTGGRGAIRLHDAIDTHIIHNTIANNISTATNQASFSGAPIPSQSAPRTAGIFSLLNSQLLNDSAGLPGGSHSDPELANNIIWQNESHCWTDGQVNCGIPDDPPVEGQQIQFVAFDDLGVEGGVGCLTVTDSVLSNTADPDLCAGSNAVTGDPMFEDDAEVGALTSGMPGAGTESGRVEGYAAFDEGGNFIDVRYGLHSDAIPGGHLISKGDFHIAVTSSASGIAAASSVTDDFDGDLRPIGAGRDAGADEIAAGPGTPPPPPPGGTPPGGGTTPPPGGGMPPSMCTPSIVSASASTLAGDPFVSNPGVSVTADINTCGAAYEPVSTTIAHTIFPDLGTSDGPHGMTCAAGAAPNTATCSIERRDMRYFISQSASAAIDSGVGSIAATVTGPNVAGLTGTVEITRAEFDPSINRLVVFANSALEGTAPVQITIHRRDGSKMGPLNMTYKELQTRWQRYLRRDSFADNPPISVEVTISNPNGIVGDGTGDMNSWTATADVTGVPELTDLTGMINVTHATFDTATNRIVVVAKSGLGGVAPLTVTVIRQATATEIGPVDMVYQPEWNRWRMVMTNADFGGPNPPVSVDVTITDPDEVLADWTINVPLTVQ